MGLRLAAVIRVRNEIDIIESFIRHHAAYFDCLLVLDDGSVDGSYELLCALRDEGLPLILERTVSVGMNQAEDVTRLSRLAVDQHAADWVIPLDADEFIEPPAGLSLKDVLADLPAELRRVGWSNFLWSRDQDEAISPILRLTDRLPPRRDVAKVIIPAAIVRLDDFHVFIGNHAVFCRGAHQDAPLFAGFELCHYPIRSRTQYAGKAVLCYLQHRASSTFNPGEGFQYDEPFSIIGSNIEAIVPMMENESRRYSVEPHVTIDETARHAPLRYVGGPLTHHRVTGGHWIANILLFAEEMALRFARQSRQEDALADALAGTTSDLVDASLMDRVIALQERLLASQERLHSSYVARADLEAKLAEVEAELSGSIALVARQKTQCETLEEQLSESERGLSQVRSIAEQQAADLSRRLVRLARWLSPS